MASEKKVAVSAMATLKKVLRGNREAISHLRPIERFVGELRQARSALREEVRKLKDRISARDAALTNVKAERAEFWQRLQQQRAECRQQRGEISRLCDIVEALKMELREDEVSPALGRRHGVSDRMAIYWMCFKELRRGMKRPPELMTTMTVGNLVPPMRVGVFDTCDVMRGVQALGWRESMFIVGAFVYFLWQSDMAVGFTGNRNAVLSDPSMGPKAIRMSKKRETDRWAMSWLKGAADPVPWAAGTTIEHNSDLADSVGIAEAREAKSELRITENFGP